MLQSEVRGILTGSLLVVDAQQLLVRATAAAVVAEFQADIATALRPLYTLRKHLLEAKPALRAAVRVGATAGGLRWKSPAATMFRASLKLHQDEVAALTKRHAAELALVEGHIGKMEAVARRLTTLDPIVIATTAAQLTGHTVCVAVAQATDALGQQAQQLAPALAPHAPVLGPVMSHG